MAKVFSWKVAPEKYSYLVKDDSTNSYIRNKITDSNILHTMANIVNGWSEGEYSSNYNSMKAEVNSVYGEGVLPEDYREYWNISNITEGTVVLLSGKDGRGGGNYGGGDDGSTGGDYFLDETDYKALIDKIEKEFEAQRNALEAKIEQLKTELARIASDSVGEAWNDTYNASKRLKEIEDRLREAAENAANALDFFRNLSSGGAITYQEIINTFNQITEFNNWYNDYGSGITRMYSGYTQFETGLVGEFADGLEGAWGVIGTHLNSLSGTVGTVETRINAAEATISDVATWYNLSADTISEVKRTIDAKIGLIEDAVNYINNDLQNSIVSTINGMAGTITTNIDTRYDGAINNIQQELNGLSASVSTNITHYNALEGRLAQVEDEMNASAHGDDPNYTKAVTIAESAWTHADQMRETWSQASGMLRTVSDLVIQKDSEGVPIYRYVSGGTVGTGENEEWVEFNWRVYFIGYNNNSALTFSDNASYKLTPPSGNGWKTKGHLEHYPDGSNSHIYLENVYPDYIVGAMSYIQQKSDKISMAVSRDDIKAAIELSVEDDASKIYLGADSILLDGQVIADSLTAKAANIGGVHIGYGMISAQTGDKKWALRSDGVLEAASANVRGVITADQLILGDGMTGGQGPQGIEDYVNSFVVQAGGMTETEVRNIVSGMAQAGQWGVVDPGGDYYIVGTTISGTSADSAFTVSKSGCLIAKNGIFSGTVFATNGVFNGKVYAKEGEFAGSISANNGYFRGELVAANFSNGTVTGSNIYGSDIYGSSLHIGGNTLDILNGDLSNANHLNFASADHPFRIQLDSAPGNRIKFTFFLNKEISTGGVVSQKLESIIDGDSREAIISVPGYSGSLTKSNFDTSEATRIITDIYAENVGNSAINKTIVVNRPVQNQRGIFVDENLYGKLLIGSSFDDNFSVAKDGCMSAKSGYFTGTIEASEINGSEIFLTEDYPEKVYISYIERPNVANITINVSKTFSKDYTILIPTNDHHHEYIGAIIKAGENSGVVYDLDYDEFMNPLDSINNTQIGIDEVSLCYLIKIEGNDAIGSRLPESYFGNYDFYTLFGKSYSDASDEYWREGMQESTTLYLNSFNDGRIFKCERNNGFYVDSTGTIQATKGIFGGSITLPFVTIDKLATATLGGKTTYLLDDRSCVYVEKYYDDAILLLPSPPSVRQGFTYDIIVRPGLSRTQSDGAYIYANSIQNGAEYIDSYSTPQWYSGGYLHLKGGRYQFCRLPASSELTAKWSLIMNTGAVEFYESRNNLTFRGKSAPLTSFADTTSEFCPTSVRVYSGNTALAGYGLDNTLLLKTGGNISITGGVS